MLCTHLVKEKEIYQYSIAPGLPYTDATEMQPHELCYRRSRLMPSNRSSGEARTAVSKKWSAWCRIVSDMPARLFAGHDSKRFSGGQKADEGETCSSGIAKKTLDSRS